MSAPSLRVSQRGARRHPRSLRFGIAALCVFVGVVLIFAAPAAAAPTIDDVTVDDDESFAGATDTHTVTVSTTNTTGTSAIEIDLSGWSQAQRENTDVTTGTLVEGPTNGVITVEPDSGQVVVDFSVTHPTAAGNVQITAAFENGSDSADSSIAVQSIGLDPSFTNGEVDTVGASVTTTLTDLDHELNSDLVVSSPDLTNSEIYEMLDGADTPLVKQRGGDIRVSQPTQNAPDPIELSLRDFGPATYRFDFSPVDSEVETRREFEAVDPEVEGSLGTDRYEVPAGDLVTIDLSVSGGGGYLLVGADHKASEGHPTNFLDIVYVTGGSLTINTRLLGTDVPSEKVYRTDGTAVSYLHDGPDSGGTDAEQRLDDVRFLGENGRQSWDDLTAFREELGISPQPSPLQPERYRFVLGADGTVEIRDDGIVDFRHPLARSNLHVTQPEVKSVTTYVAPRGAANEFDEPGSLGEIEGLSTERNTVAKEDRLVFEVETTGMYGALHHIDEEPQPDTFEDGIHPEDFQTFLDLQEGIFLEAIQTDPDANEAPTELDFGAATDGEVYIIPESAEGENGIRERFYVVVDTRDAGGFDGVFSEGESDDFEFEFGYESPPDERFRFPTDDLDPPAPFNPESEPTEDGTEHYPYFGSNEVEKSVTAPFSVEESFAEYDRTTGHGKVILTNRTDATLTGKTNVAPESEFTIQVIADNRSDPTKITIDDVDVSEDGTFVAQKDLSELEVGEGVEVEFYAEQRLVDKRGGVLPADPSAPSTFEVTEIPGEIVLDAGESTTIEATVVNTGAATETKPIDFGIGGADVDSVSRTLESDEGVTPSFDSGELSPGTYTYTVSTPDDEAASQIIIEENTTNEPVANQTANNVTANDSEDAGTEPDSGSDDETPAEEDTGDENSGDDSDDSEEAPDEPEDALPGPIGGVVAGVGARHAIGGAAVVGGAHVLGYWS